MEDQKTQLELITAIRIIVPTENLPAFELVTQTNIVDIVARVLSYLADETMYWYMKLEVLWILINLTADDDHQVIQRVLCSEPEQFFDV